MPCVDGTERDVPMLTTLALYIQYAVIVGILIYGIVRALGWAYAALQLRPTSFQADCRW